MLRTLGRHSGSSLTIVFLLAPVMRTMARMLFPSTSEAITASFFSGLSVYMSNLHSLNLGRGAEAPCEWRWTSV